MRAAVRTGFATRRRRGNVTPRGQPEPPGADRTQGGPPQPLPRPLPRSRKAPEIPNQINAMMEGKWRSGRLDVVWRCISSTWSSHSRDFVVD